MIFHIRAMVCQMWMKKMSSAKNMPHRTELMAHTTNEDRTGSFVHNILMWLKLKLC